LGVGAGDFGAVEEQHADRQFLEDVDPAAARLVLLVRKQEHVVLHLVRVQLKLEREKHQQNTSDSRINRQTCSRSNKYQKIFVQMTYL
jgi:hypothetical protein